MALIGYLGKSPDDGISFIVSREVFRTPKNLKWSGSVRYRIVICVVYPPPPTVWTALVTMYFPSQPRSHKHDLIIKPYMPKVNDLVLVLYFPVFNGDGVIFRDSRCSNGISRRLSRL